jgi:hypothetical protein
MAKSTATCNSILALIFNATAFADIAENDTSAPLANLYVSLHKTDPGVGGSQLTGEADYGAYARKAVARTTGGWTTPASGSTDNVAILQFDECNGSTNDIDYVAIGTAESGAGRVLYAGQLSSTRTISTGIQPQFNARALVVTES